VRARLAAPSLGPAPALVLALALVLAATSGCVTLTRASAGSMPPASAITSLRHGDALPSVLARCGSPLEVYRHAGGLLLLYRERRYAFDRLELDPARGLSYAGLSQVSLAAASNARLNLERGNAAEERLALLFDRDDRLAAIAFRGSDGRRAP
jgi:hypothetical protein